jgi:effector-binding domain-containing protein
MDSAPQQPPRGDYQKAESYINRLIELIEANKLEVIHTDLQKFDPGSIQDHYRLDLNDYQIEISHSKLPTSGTDSYVMLFTNLKNVESGSAQKAILAYTQLSNTQFEKFKTVAESQIEERRRLEEEKRFKDALAPIDSLLDQAGNNQPMAKAITPIITEDKEPEIVKEESTLEINEENNSPLPPYSSIASSEEPKAENSELSKPDSNPYF